MERAWLFEECAYLCDEMEIEAFSAEASLEISNIHWITINQASEAVLQERLVRN